MFEMDFGVRMVRAEKRFAPCCPMRSKPNCCRSPRPPSSIDVSALLTPITISPWSYGVASTAPTPTITVTN